MSAFVENGWVITSDPNVIVPAWGSNYEVFMRHGSQIMRTSVRNFDNVPQPVSHSFVTDIESGPRGGLAPILPIELSGGITEYSTIEEMIEVFGHPDSVEEDDLGLVYMWSSEGSIIFVFFSIQADRVSILFLSTYNQIHY